MLYLDRCISDVRDCTEVDINNSWRTSGSVNTRDALSRERSPQSKNGETNTRLPRFLFCYDAKNTRFHGFQDKKNCRKPFSLLLRRAFFLFYTAYICATRIEIEAHSDLRNSHIKHAVTVYRVSSSAMFNAVNFLFLWKPSQVMYYKAISENTRNGHWTRWDLNKKFSKFIMLLFIRLSIETIEKKLRVRKYNL